MEQRLPINSASLKERFPEAYREFFSKCAIVCSAPRSVTWIGEHAVRVGGLSMRQSIPIRTYVGIAPTAASRIRIASQVTYDPFLNQFRQDTLPSEEYHKPIERQLPRFLKEVGGYEGNFGFDVHILTELPFERAIGAVGSFFVPLFSALLLHKEILSLKQIKLWAASPVADLQKNKETKFDEILRLIWKWEGLIYMTPSAANPFSALLPSSTPVLFASKRPPETGSERAQQERMAHGLNWVDQARWYGARTTELFKQHVGWPLPFDWGLLSASEAWSLRDTVFSIVGLNEELQRTARSMKKICSSLFENFAPDDLPDFLRICRQDDISQIWQQYIGGLHLLSFQALLRFKKIIERGPSRAETEALFDIINKVQAMLYLLNFSSRTLENVAHRFRTLVSQRSSGVEIGIKLNSTSRKGNLLFAMPSSVARIWIPEIVEELQDKIDKKITLDYASWIDGYEEGGGLKVEQFLAQGVYSDFVRLESLKMTRWTRNGEVKNSLVEQADLKKDRFDIFLDLPHGKLFVKGKECSSQEIPSQKSAVTILDALLTAEGHRLHNKMLPESSYAKYRNEFQGKIVGPLVALVKKRLKRELPLKVEGTLTDFIVSLDPKGFEIGVVKKMG